MDIGFEEAERQFAGMVEKYKSKSSQWFEAIETELGIDGRELTRRILQGHVDSRGKGDIGPSLVAANGIILTHRRLFKRKLQTMFGEINIERIGYSSPNDQVVFPLDAMFNLPALSFSAGIQRFLARHVATTSFEEVLKLIQEVTGVVIGKPQALEIVQRCAIDFDAFYDGKRAHKRGREPILVLTTDGKGVVMRPDGLRDTTRERAEKAQPTMKSRLAPGEKSNRKRMAQVASIYSIKRFVRSTEEVIDELARREAAKHRPRPSNKRVWASVEKDADNVIGDLFNDANKRDPNHKKSWVILIDGNRHQLRLVKAQLKKEGIEATIILDIIHVIEYLWDAARLFNTEKNHAGCESWVNEQLKRILDGSAGRVAGTIRMQAAKRKLTHAEAKTAKDSSRYLANNKIYMNYANYLEQGFPIATGVIEGACRYLIKDRMDITGARWSLNGAESVLKFRSLVASGDFDDYWKFHRNQEHQRNHLSKFGDLAQLNPLRPS